MAKKSQLELLPPNKPDGFHDRSDERIERKSIEIGKGLYLDFVTKSTLVECDLLLSCGSRGINSRTRSASCSGRNRIL